MYRNKIILKLSHLHDIMKKIDPLTKEIQFRIVDYKTCELFLFFDVSDKYITLEKIDKYPIKYEYFHVYPHDDLSQLSFRLPVVMDEIIYDKILDEIQVVYDEIIKSLI